MTKMRKHFLLGALVLLIVGLCAFQDDCDDSTSAQSTSGVGKATVALKPGADGMTIEQHNISARLVEDNKPGAIKHLYVISPYSGQVILYSTVKGKVTSGNKRLSPAQAEGAYNKDGGYNGSAFRVPLSNGGSVLTKEILGDDGTYGTSGDYLYWWDVRGAYHQHYLTGGQIVTISDVPLPVKSVTINVEQTKE